MRYSIEPRRKIYVKRYGLLSFPKNIGKNVSNKYSHKLLDRNILSRYNKNCFKKSNSKNSKRNW